MSVLFENNTYKENKHVIVIQTINKFLLDERVYYVFCKVVTIVRIVRRLWLVAFISVKKR